MALANAHPLVALLAASAIALGCAPEQHGAEPSPSPLATPAGEMGEMVRYGEEVIRNTGVHAKGYVGNKLNCTSCHLDAGRREKAAPFTGVYAAYPQYRARNAEVTTMEERVNACFQRSMNGKPLPHDSKEMRGMIAYMAWLSTGTPVGQPPATLGIPKLEPVAHADAKAGEKVYQASCAACHGATGQGMGNFPPLWGNDSFNIGAGMARLNTASAFIKWNMPMGREGTLSDQEAYDVAAFVLSHDLPDFPGKAHDWPKGGKPADAPY